MGVRGIKLVGPDAVVGMSILRHVNYEGVPNTDLHEREVYLRQTSYLRRVTNETAENETDRPEVMLSPERLAFLGAAEDFILTVTENGIGKRTSAYEYRITNRGGQGIWNIDVTDRAGSVVAGFPVNHSDQIMLVTNSGQLIRCAVDEIGITGRRTQGLSLIHI